MASADFDALLDRLREVRRHMLPSRFSPTGIYTPQQRERARGYRLLAHAEIETFLEAIADHYLTRRMGEWQAIQSANSRRRELVRTQVVDVHLISGLIAADQRTLATTIKRNHGVKRDNVAKLFQPLGFDIQAEFPTLVANLHSFGEIRGEYAHGGGVISLIDPRSELETVKNLIPDLRRLDALMAQ